MVLVDIVISVPLVKYLLLLVISLPSVSHEISHKLTSDNFNFRLMTIIIEFVLYNFTQCVNGQKILSNTEIL